MHFKIIDKISARMSLETLSRFSGTRFLPIVYHTVGELESMPYLKGLYNVPTANEFKLALDFILKYYKPLDLKDVIHFKQTGELPGNGQYFHLSFDDGLRQCKEIIAPILKEKGIPATFFINTAFVGNKDFLHRFRTVLLDRAIKADKQDGLKRKVEEFFNLQFTCRYKAAKYVFALRYPDLETIDRLIKYLELDIEGELHGYKPYMEISDIKDLLSHGHTLGAHSTHHPEFFLLSENEQLKQATGSMAIMKEWFQLDYNVFAFPFTDDGVKASFFERLSQEANTDLTFACAGLKKDKIKSNVHRVAMDNYRLNAENRLKSEMLYYILKVPFGKNVIKRI